MNKVFVAPSLKQQHCPTGWRWEVGALVLVSGIDGGRLADQQIHYISSSHQTSVLFL